MLSEKSKISQFQSEKALKKSVDVKNDDKDLKNEKFDPIKECDEIMIQRK